MALVKRNSVSSSAYSSGGCNDSLHDDILVGGKSLAEAQKRKARTFAHLQKAAERVAAATSRLAIAITEAASAAEELRKAIDQISVGAEEVSNALQQSLQSVNHASRLIDKAFERQESPFKMVLNVEQQTAAIGEVVKPVALIANQSNLPPLNAAIEAPRAGHWARG